MARTIRVDDEVYSALQRKAQPFEDSPNSVLRRELGLGPISHRSTMPEDRRQVSEASPIAHDKTTGEDRDMSDNKFNDDDRKSVIYAVESHLGIKLKKIGRRKNILTDDAGNPYCIVGGQDWHGIPDEIFSRDHISKTDAKLIVGFIKGSSISIYSTPLQQIILNDDRLSHTKEKKVRHFHIIWSRDQQPTIKEVPEAKLDFIMDIKHDQKSTGRKDHETQFQKLFQSLTDQQREEIIKKFL